MGWPGVLEHAQSLREERVRTGMDDLRRMWSENELRDLRLDAFPLALQRLLVLRKLLELGADDGW